MTRHDVSQLIADALSTFDDPGTSLAAIARRCLRIASLRRDFGNELWLQTELIDPQPGQQTRGHDPSMRKIVDRMRSLLQEDAVESVWSGAFEHFMRNRSVLVDGEEQVYGFSLGQMENEQARARAAYDSLTVPSGLSQADTYRVLRDADASRAQMLPMIHHRDRVMERVRTAMHAFLVQTESELAEGQTDSTLFLQAQAKINGLLAELAPQAVEKFVSAQDRLSSGDPEDLAHALTSCRRMLKSLADALYPATNELKTGADGVERSMSDDAYRNRLLQFANDKLAGHGQNDVLKTTINTLGSRLKTLDSLASKGVHDSVSQDEAETCVLWTYLLAGDLLRIASSEDAHRN